MLEKIIINLKVFFLLNLKFSLKNLKNLMDIMDWIREC